MRILSLLLLFCVASPGLLYGQTEISVNGSVKDKKTQEPIAGATIEALSSQMQPVRKQITNVSGAFRIKKEEISYIRITALGYEDTVIAMPGGSTLLVMLVQKPLLGEEITVTAQKHTTFSQDVPISISIVKTKEITERSPESIDYSLRYIPGVSVTESQVSIRGSSGYARSVGSRVLFLLDGMPYLSADNGDIKFDALPIMNIDRIEVVKGAGSALYGSSALGGVINVITRKPTDSVHGAINANIGEYDEVKYPEWRIPGLGGKFASVEGGLTGTIGETGLLGSFVVRRNEGYRLGDDSYKSSGFFKMTNPLSDHDRLETSFLLANENHGGFLFWKDLGHALMPSDSLGAVNGRIHSLKAHLQSSLQSILSDHFILTSRANIHYTDFSTDPSQVGDPPGAHSNATSYDIEFEGNSDFLKSLYLTTGISGIYQTVSSDLYQSHHGMTLSGFAQAEYRIEPLIFTLGLRGDATRYDDSSTLGSISPKFGLTLDAGDGLNFRGSLGTGFRAPTIAEKFIDQTFNGFIHVIPNPGLTPEKSYSAEIGGSYRTRNLYVDGAVFYSSFDNLIEPHFVSYQGSPAIQFGNLTEAEIFGHEEVIEFYPLSSDDLSLRLGYTYVFPQDRVTKQILNFRPRHLLQARAETKFGAFSLSSDLRYISKYESVDSILITQVPNGDARVDAYIWDARIAYTAAGLFGLPVKFSFQVQNLLNYYYVEIVGNIAPIRNFTFRVETVFLMIDTHCHIQTEQFDADREEVLAKASAAGVTHFIVPAIDLESFDATLKVTAEHGTIFCGLGIHPHSAKEWNSDVRRRISEEIDRNPKVVAIGEIGLDYYYDFCPKDIQIAAFRDQIELAKEKGKPIIIHTRDTIDETLAIVEEYYGRERSDGVFGQFHCFSGNSEQMKRAVSLGFCVSYTGNITFKNTNLTDVVRETPEDRILIETDSPYLAPVPYRGKRNSPEHIGLVAKRIAEIKQKDINEIMTLTTQNAKRLFHLSIGAAMFILMSLLSVQSSTAQVGNKPPDSVMTKERRDNEEIIKKQRDELLRAQEERRQDSIKAAQLEQDEQMKEAMEQARKDSIRAVERMADEERIREKLKTPIAWKAIGIGGGIGVGNLSGVNQGNRVKLAPTSVFASSFNIGTAITRGIDFDISYSSFSFGDDLTRDQLYKADLYFPPSTLSTNPNDPRPRHYLVPTHEDMGTKYLSFDFRFVINPRSPVKFYLGLGYMHVTITSTQQYYSIDSVGLGTVQGPSQTLTGSFSRGGMKGLIGARFDVELGDKFILTPFAQIAAGFLFTGETPPAGFDFYTTADPIVFTHLNVGATLYFGWFGVARR